MCIIIVNTPKATLAKQTLRNCWENNGDGAGMLFIDSNGLNTYKELTSFKNFYNEYMRIRKEHTKTNIVLHFRISTHGKVNETNCHPFMVDEHIGFAHNGMIYDMPHSQDYSDTWMFNEHIMKNMKAGFEYNDVVLDMLESFIGAGNKLAFLNDKNEFFIVNEKQGHWSNGCWFSNSSYKQVNNWVDYGGTRRAKVGFGSSWDRADGFGSFGVTTPQAKSWSSITDDLNDRALKATEMERVQCSCCQVNTLYSIAERNNDLCRSCADQWNIELKEDTVWWESASDEVSAKV
jgi:predicted glutamine amidotransferase